MTDWTLVLVPLLVLPIIALFRFVGCGISAVGVGGPTATAPSGPFGTSDGSGTTAPPSPASYSDRILVGGAGTIIGYWRLVEPVSTAPISDALDQKYVRPGDYVSHFDALPTEAAEPPKSEPRDPPHFTPHQSLIYAERPSTECRIFEGGYVRIPSEIINPPFIDLYTDPFTIEAWIDAGLFAADYEYRLFDAYPLPHTGTSDNRGFRLSVRGSTTNTGYWTLDLGDRTNLFSNAQVPTGGPSYVALTFSGASKQARLYVAGNPVGTETVTAYTLPDTDVRLLIGLGRAERANAVVLRYPFTCSVQEVVLHRRVLLATEIADRVKWNV